MPAQASGLLNKMMINVSPSATYAMIALAQKMKAQGQDVISLAAGEPDFPTPAHICDAAIAAIRAGRTKYTPVAGLASLRAAVTDKFQRENNLSYGAEQVLVSNGGKQVIAAALAGTLDPGDEVIIPTPYWVSYPDMVRLNGATPVIVDTDKAAKLTPELLQAAISGKTKWLILNSPNNPSGVVYSQSELGALAEVLRPHQRIMVLSDEIYEHLTYGVEFATIAAVPDFQDRVLVANGVSKSYAMTGWRIGYGAGPVELIKAMETWQGQVSSGASSISQHAALQALNGPQDHIREYGGAFERRKELVVRALAGCEGLEIIPPQGAFYVFALIDAVMGKQTPKGRKIETDMDFALGLLEETGVSIVPGSAFGMGPGLRISFAAADPVLTDACGRIASFWVSLRP
jgi:aspartate aminotransferase